MTTPETILAQIVAEDAAQWSQPSNSGALRIHDLEAQYERLTGQPCPPWPSRGRPTYREELTAAGPQLVIPGCERKPIENGKPAQLGLFG